MCLCTFLSKVLTAVEAVSYKGMNKTPKMSLLSVTMPVYVIAKEAVEEKVIFVLELQGPSSSSFPQIPQKEYLRN